MKKPLLRVAREARITPVLHECMADSMRSYLAASSRETKLCPDLAPAQPKLGGCCGVVGPFPQPLLIRLYRYSVFLYLIIISRFTTNPQVLLQVSYLQQLAKSTSATARTRSTRLEQSYGCLPIGTQIMYERLCPSHCLPLQRRLDCIEL